MKIIFSKISQNSQENVSASLYFQKLNFIDSRDLDTGVFFLYFVKFLRTAILLNTYKWLWE